jgi:hypothetical protein
MPATQLRARLDTMSWVLIYGGLFAAILGYASRVEAPSTGWVLMVGGGVLTAVGAVLVWVRSRLDDGA